jgi:hypothetical protein
MTHDATKFAGTHKSHTRQYIIKCLFIQTQSMRALIDTCGGATTLVLQIYDPVHSQPFSFSILHFPLIALSGL